jgi:hypothetical protein
LSEVIDSFAEEDESSWQPGGGPMREESFIPPGLPGGSSAAMPAGPAGPAGLPPGVPALAGSSRPVPARPVFVDEDGEPFDVEEFFSPLCGPPEGADAWLARVASPVADAHLAGIQPAAGGAEALAAGFTHRDKVAGARGFAAGGLLDVMEPGPVLAGFAEDAVGGGLPVLSDDELVGVMGAARRLASRAAAIELAAVAGLNSRRAAAARAAGDGRQHRHVGDEIAAALTLTCRAADKLLDLATGVGRLPAVAGALAAGRIDVPRAMVYHHELAALADVPAAAIAAVTITDAASLTTGQLREVLHRAVLAHDPEAAAKRRRKAEKDARVESWAEHRGTAALAGRDLPPAEVLAADEHVDALARELKKAGTGGTLEQLRAKVFLALLTSQPLYTLLPGNQDPDQDPGRGPAGPDSPGTSDARPGDGDSDRPGGNDGENEGDDDAGQGNGGGTRPPRPGSGPRPGPSGGPGSGGLGLPAGLAGSVNLTVPLATWLGLSDHPGEAAGHGPLDAATTRDLTTRLTAQPGSLWCLTILGHDGRAIAHGCARAGPGPPGPGTGPRPWLAGLTIHWLETNACGHARETFAYQPSPALRHLIKTRDRTCCFPGCRRAARRCDDDHTVPHDQGGRTCECNLAPLCRRHHAAKQAPGWHLQQAQPGTLVWTLPSGRKATVTSRPYAT